MEKLSEKNPIYQRLYHIRTLNRHGLDSRHRDPLEIMKFVNQINDTNLDE